MLLRNYELIRHGTEAIIEELCKCRKNYVNVGWTSILGFLQCDITENVCAFK